MRQQHLLLLSGALLLAACNTTPTPTTKPAEPTSVGTSGGILTSTSGSITVPAGALPSGATLTVSSTPATTSAPSGYKSASDALVLTATGATTFSKPVEVKVKYNASALAALRANAAVGTLADPNNLKLCQLGSDTTPINVTVDTTSTTITGSVNTPGTYAACVPTVLPGLTLGLAGDINAAAGTNATLTATISRTGGLTGDVTLALQDAPAGITASPVTVAANTTNGALIVSVAGTVAPGAYPLKVRATSGTLSVDATATLTVVAAAQPSFSLTLDAGTLNLRAGGTSTVDVTVTPTNGFSGAVNVTLSGAPQGLTGTLDLPTGTTHGTLTLTATNATPVGAHALSVNGTSGDLKAGAALTVNVVAPFTLTAAESAGVKAGGSVNLPVSVTRTDGYSGDVTVSLEDASGVLSADPVTLNATGRDTNLVIRATSGVATQSLPVTIVATDASGFRTTRVVSVAVTTDVVTPATVTITGTATLPEPADAAAAVLQNFQNGDTLLAPGTFSNGTFNVTLPTDVSALDKVLMPNQALFDPSPYASNCTTKVAVSGDTARVAAVGEVAFLRGGLRTGSVQNVVGDVNNPMSSNTGGYVWLYAERAMTVQGDSVCETQYYKTSSSFDLNLVQGWNLVATSSKSLSGTTVPSSMTTITNATSISDGAWMYRPSVYLSGSDGVTGTRGASTTVTLSASFLAGGPTQVVSRTATVKQVNVTPSAPITVSSSPITFANTGGGAIPFTINVGAGTPDGAYDVTIDVADQISTSRKVIRVFIGNVEDGLNLSGLMTRHEGSGPYDLTDGALSVTLYGQNMTARTYQGPVNIDGTFALTLPGGSDLSSVTNDLRKALVPLLSCYGDDLSGVTLNTEARGVAVSNVSLRTPAQPYGLSPTPFGTTDGTTVDWNVRYAWVYVDRDVTVNATPSVSCSMQATDLNLKAGWNALKLAYSYDGESGLSTRVVTLKTDADTVLWKY
ncbi:beta strand repeat-containing protein [Deinococcus pimensis]|uniref:beta strand repeat-containing protein n=1 Tax=Deinococcus pimensis TaxID=309888 RepID=UPI0012F91F24|nr:hypothetical protein [Deinococcus pimensis]